MSFKLVEGPPPEAPFHCLVTRKSDGEFIDFGDWTVECEIPRIYIRRDVIERVAREQLGMVSAIEVEMLRDRLERFEERLIETEQVNKAVATLEAFAAGQEADEEISYGGSS